MSAVPEITPLELAQKLAEENALVLLDVREEWELARACIKDERLVLAPMSALARKGLDALPDISKLNDAEIIVICHHGVRSAQVTGWLRQQGLRNVYSLAGGLEAYAIQVDDSIGRY